MTGRPNLLVGVTDRWRGPGPGGTARRSAAARCCASHGARAVRKPGRRYPRLRDHRCGDHRLLGIIKADIGIRDGRIVRIRPASGASCWSASGSSSGRPPKSSAATVESSPQSTVDCHVRLICRRSSRQKTLAAGHRHDHRRWRGPAGHQGHHSHSRQWHLARMLESLDGWPVNFAAGKHRDPDALWEQRWWRIGFQTPRRLRIDPGGHRPAWRSPTWPGVQGALHSDAALSMRPD